MLRAVRQNLSSKANVVSYRLSEKSWNFYKNRLQRDWNAQGYIAFDGEQKQETPASLFPKNLIQNYISYVYAQVQRTKGDWNNKNIRSQYFFMEKLTHKLIFSLLRHVSCSGYYENLFSIIGLCIDGHNADGSSSSCYSFYYQFNNDSERTTARTTANQSNCSYWE